MSDAEHCKSNTPYHHGNLKEALVEAYLALLGDNEPDAISLRKLAAHIQVAPTAVYNHYSDKEALTVAVRTCCLNHFADYLNRAYTENDKPELNLLNLGKAYFRYSVEYTPYYKMIFQSTTQQEHVTEDLLAAGMNAEARLRKTIIDLLLHYNIPVTQYNEGLGAFACWALSHGITSLAAIHINRAACIGERWPKEFMLNDEKSVNLAFESLNTVLVKGILAAARSD